MDSITLIWFAGAVRLFSRRRPAWIGSLVGTGASAGFFGAFLVTVAGYFVPGADVWQDCGSALITHLIGLIGIAGIVSVLLAIALGLFIGLVRMRAELR